MQKKFRLERAGEQIILIHHQNSDYDQIVNKIDAINDLLICTYKVCCSKGAKYPFHIIENLDMDLLKKAFPEDFI